jgi:hypothetical protein
MKSSTDPDGLTLSDSPGCFRIFGTFFCVLGAAAVFAAITEMTAYYPIVQVGLAVGLGLAVFSAGIYLIYNAPGSRIVLSKTRTELHVRRRGLFRREDLTIGLSEIRKVYLVQGKDIDGGPVYTLRIELENGGELPLTRLWLHDRGNLESALSLLGEYLRVGEMKEEGGR